MFRLERVTAGYGDASVLRDVSLAVPDGSVVALLGPNGAGKTTLLRVASGLLEPTSGRIGMDNVVLTGKAPDVYARHGVCHIPEGRGIFASMTVRENILLQAKPGEEDVALDRAVEAFPRLGERMSQRAGTMSGGEQQMLAVARAYVAGASCVLLDEVSMGLAPKLIDEIFEYLHSLAAAGTALLLVEQYVNRAVELADFVYILNKGRVAFVGEAEELGEEQILASYLGA